jgi:hypothetical protein
MINLKTSVRIARPIADVFAYVSTRGGSPPELGRARRARDVVARRRRLDLRDGARPPTGWAHNDLEIVALDPPAEFAIRPRPGPTLFLYRYRFSADGAATVVELDGEIEVPRLLARRGMRHLRRSRAGQGARRWICSTTRSVVP